MSNTNRADISALVASLSREFELLDKVTLQDIISKIGDRAFGILILLFCIPNFVPIPIPTGLSTITGIPIVLIALHMVVGRSQLWVPDFIGRKSINGKKLSMVFDASVPYLQKIEKFLHPRFDFLHCRKMQHVLGMAILTMAIVMSLPIPWMNMLPASAMALIAIGIIERDGAFTLIGFVVAFITLSVLGTAVETILGLLQSFLQ
jgi:hypothetical protein